MIESTALFCSMSYLACAVRSLDRWRLHALAGAALFGALAAMVKITTFFAFVLAAGLCFLWAWWRAGAARFSRPTVIRLVVSAVPLALLPLVCGVLWTEFADSVRAHNPLMVSFLTPATLRRWTFGTSAQRLSSQLWLTLLNRTVPDAIGQSALLVAAVALVIAGRRRRVLFVACGVLFVSVPLTFTNLHVVHNYYAYANGVFLIAAIGWCVVGSLERAERWRWLGAGLLVCTISASLWRYQQVYLPLQRQNPTLLLDTARIVQTSTTADDAVLILGLDWDPTLPYYAQRRALMNRDHRPPSDPVMQRALANLRDRPVGAMVVCAGALRQRPLIASWLRVTGLSPMPRRTMSCEIYTRPT
jgi:hypothetical protein